MNPTEIQNEIDQIMSENKLDDLKRFLNKRHCLNQSNMYLNYMFHIIQSAGIFTTTIAAGYNIKEFVWVGIGLNIFATLINVFEQTNNTLSKNIMKDIIAIKNDKYVDEGLIVEIDKDGSAVSSKPPATPKSPSVPTLSSIKDPLLKDNSV